jgi:thymidylate synthase
MNSLDLRYQKILQDILLEGKEKGDRTGTGTISVFGKQIRHDMSEGFPLLTTKKMAVKTMMTELKWFLKGDTNIKYLVDNGCNVWNGDAYKNYEKYGMANLFGENLTMDEFIEQIKTDDEFAKKWGDLGRIYGAQWREWIGFEQFDNHAETIYVDQIANLIRNIKENPDSRRLMVTAWNPSELHQVVLPPCHYGFQMYTRELSFHERWSLYSDKPYDGNGLGMVNALDFMDDEGIPTRSISLMWNQRSVDTFLGLPFNISSYAALLCLIAEEVGMVAGELVGNLGDTHLYSNHLEQAKEQVSREIYDLPTVEFSNINILDGEFDYEVKDYKYHPSIKAPLSN